MGLPPGLVPLVREPSPPVAALVSGVEQQPHEELVERVREVVPDVLPAHVFKLLDQHKAAHSGSILDVVIHTLLEDSSYPKDLKGKGKARAAKDNPSEIPGDVNASINYAILDANRSRGPVYRTLCLVRLGASVPRRSLTCGCQKYLCSNFPAVDRSSVVGALSLNKGCYAPTYLYLLRQGANPTSAVPCSPQQGKVKRKANSKAFLTEQEFMKEHTWLVEYMERYDGTTASGTLPSVVGDGRDEIECGCCFANYPFVSISASLPTPH